MALHFDYKARAHLSVSIYEMQPKKSEMDPELGEVTEEEGDAIDVRAALAK